MRGAVVALLIGLVLLAGCASPDDDSLCAPTLITNHTDAALDATTASLSEPGWPLTGVGPVICTARLTVTYGDGKTVQSEIALVNAPIADITAKIDDLTSEQGWTRNDPGRIWTDPYDAGHRIRIREIEEGTLVEVT